MVRSSVVWAVVLLAVLLSTTVLAASDEPGSLESRVAALERQSRAAVSGGGGVAILFGAFCALWAQNSGRGPWKWFFFGLFLNVIAVAVLLSKNAGDRRRSAGQPSGA